DEFRIKHINDTERTTILIPPATTRHGFEYSFEVSVKDAIEKMRGDYSLAPADQTQGYEIGTGRWGLYHAQFGTWLDEGRRLFDYEMQEGQTLELRALTNQFVMRVHIADSNQRIALRVLPSLCVSDVIRMIHHQLTQRQVTLSNRTGHYGLYVPSKNLWMEEPNRVDLYQTAAHVSRFRILDVWTGQGKMREEDLIYKLRYILIDIRTSGRGSREHAERFLVDPLATVDTVLQTLQVDNWADDGDEWVLYTPAGEKVSEQAVVTDVMKDMSRQDVLMYRPKSKPVCLSSSFDTDIRIEVMVDFTRPLSRLLPMMCRRLGVRHGNLWGVKVESGMDLDVSKSLAEQRIAVGSRILLDVIHVPPSLNTRAATGKPFPDNVNIWEEPDTPETIQVSGNRIISGTLNKLVEGLTAEDPGEGAMQYFDYVKTFLLTYQSFTTPILFLRKLIERYHVPRSRRETWPSFEKYRTTIQLRVCNVLLQWTRHYQAEFAVPESERKSDSPGEVRGGQSSEGLGETETEGGGGKERKGVYGEAMAFVEQILAADHPGMAKQIRRNLIRAQTSGNKPHLPLPHKNILSRLKKSPSRLPSLPPSPSTSAPPSLTLPHTHASIFKYHADQVAQQLTVIDFSLFAQIRPSELLNQAWTKPDAAERAKGVIQLTRRFNAVACWTAKSVIERPTPRSRAKRLIRLIDIAGHLYDLNNFFTLMAIIAGLNKAAVSRLKLTFKELSSRSLKKLTDLERVMTAEGSYKNYRACIRSVVPPCLPY
ncbi:Son of sevenless 2, partial [Borealophlyctis nickersoniae]